MKPIIISTIALTLSLPVYAERNIKQEIIDRCRSEMGSHGAAMVKACVDMDIEAVNALTKYPEQHKPIISRCMRNMESHGYAMVKACADMDIEAEDSLSNY